MDSVENVECVLREAGLVDRVRRFDSEVPTAVAAAQVLGCEVGAIANSLLFVADEAPLLILASGAHRVDVKLVARTLGSGRIRRATPEAVARYTGQQVGGVAPVGHPAPIRTLVDEALRDHPVLWAGAGDEHCMFRATFEELVGLTGGKVLAVAGE